MVQLHPSIPIPPAPPMPPVPTRSPTVIQLIFEPTTNTREPMNTASTSAAFDVTEELRRIADGHENCRSAEEVARAALDALESLGASVCEAQNEIAKAEAALRHMGELVTTLQLLNQSMQDFSERLLRPSLGLLMSMAVRSDHGLGVPGFYDSLPGIWPGGSVTHAQRVEAAIVSMRQILEEAAGTGFYRPERDAAYIDMIPPEVRERQDQARREAAAKGGQNG